MNRTRLLLLAALLLPTVCRAQPVVSFPLEGRYRPGKYMPVRVALPNSAAAQTRTTFRLSAEGAVTTELELPTTAPEVILPWLAVGGSLRGAAWSAPGVGAGPLPTVPRPLNEGERLVGVAGGESRNVRTLFRYTVVVPVQLDAADPLPGPLAAWESLDGLVLDGPAVAWLTERRLAGLLAAGTAVALRTPDRPGGDWPWERQGDYWIVRPELLGPQGAVSPDAYAPTYAWSPGWPASFRRQAVGLAAVFTLLALAATLWRSRFAAVAVLGVTVVALGGIALWRGRQASSAAAVGAVVAGSEARTQTDEWTYHKALAPAEANMDWPDAPALVKPVFFTSRQPTQMDLRLSVAADGRPRGFTGRMQPGTSLAFLARTVRPEARHGAAGEAVTSPMREVAQSLYVRPGWRIAGQSDELSSALRWPKVVLSAAEQGSDATAEPR